MAGTKMYSTLNCRTIKNKIYKYMTSISENVYIDKLDDTVNKYNNAYHRTIKMESVGIK